jgi:DNA-binding transcriptional regulator YhcF (GntR family)
LERDPALVPVLVAPFISEVGRRQLRSHRIGYLDLSGNVYISFDNVLIHKVAPANANVQKKEGINVFADKASLILRELSIRPDGYHTVRGLASATNTSVGWASEVLRELEERGYLERKPRAGCRIRRLEHLLDEWTGNYNFLGKNNIRSFFVRAESLEEILSILKQLKVPDEVGYSLTLHSGAHLAAPFVQFSECHIYLDPKRDFERQTVFFAESLDLLETETGGNFHVVRPYYAFGAFYQARTLEGLKVVSDLQLYLDLLGFPIRGREAAEKVLAQSGLANANGWR